MRLSTSLPFIAGPVIVAAQNPTQNPTQNPPIQNHRFNRNALRQITESNGVTATSSITSTSSSASAPVITEPPDSCSVSGRIACDGTIGWALVTEEETSGPCTYSRARIGLVYFDTGLDVWALEREC